MDKWTNGQMNSNDLGRFLGGALVLALLSGCVATGDNASRKATFSTARLGQNCAYIQLNAGKEELPVAEAKKLWAQKAQTFCQPGYEQVGFRTSKNAVEGVIACTGEKNGAPWSNALGKDKSQGRQLLAQANKLDSCFTNVALQQKIMQCQPLSRSNGAIGEIVAKTIGKSFRTYQRGDLQGAIAIMELSQPQSSYEQAFVDRMLGNFNAEFGKFDDAIEYLRKSIDANVLASEDHLQMMRLYADLLFPQKQHRQAIAAYKALQQASCRYDEPVVNVRIADNYIQLEAYDEAQQALDNIAAEYNKPTLADRRKNPGYRLSGEF